jgi:shikimate kinase
MVTARSGKGHGQASGAGTIINAIATLRGAAFGIDLWTEAEVELGADLKVVRGEIVHDREEQMPGDTRLIERCVELVLRKFDVPLGAYVKTRSEIPIGSGLKSSSAAANATVAATLNAIGADVTIGALEAIGIGVDAALEVGVSITGAFDDACASALGGIVITDNEKRVLMKRVEKDASVLILVPRVRAFTANTNVLRSKVIAPWIGRAHEWALEGRFDEAMTLNGFLYCAALGFDPEPMLRALECGVTGVSLSGTGPSFVAVLDEQEELEERVREAWRSMQLEGQILKRHIQNKPSFCF